MSVIIRNFVEGEELPQALRTGFEDGSMPDWIWIAERDGKAVAVLIVAPAHVVVILLRLASTMEASNNDVRTLLIAAMKEIRERGFMAYITWLNPSRPNEGALLDLIHSAGGVDVNETQVLCGGKV